MFKSVKAALSRLFSLDDTPLPVQHHGMVAAANVEDLESRLLTVEHDLQESSFHVDEHEAAHKGVQSLS